jgi:nitrite reductase/ring-hydroxylating ferredoxin subunit
LGKRYIEAMKVDEIAAGGMKAVEAEGREIIICNSQGHYYAIEQRCGHMNAPLELGTLHGTILTCPMHFAQFDITTGEALSNPVPRDFGKEVPPPRIARFLQNVGMLMSHVKTCSIRTYETKVEFGKVLVAL